MKREDRKKKKQQIVKSMKKKEKEAALVVERFFITIKADIEREIERATSAQKHSTKKKKKKGRRHHHSSSGKSYHTTGASLLGASSAIEPKTNSFTFNNSSRETSSLSHHHLVNSVRNASPSRGRIPPIQSVNSIGNERVNATAHHQQIPLVHSHSMGQPSLSFNPTPQHHDMRSASPSRSRVSTNQSVGQQSHRIPATGGYTQRKSSAPRGRMPPMQSIVQQHGGYASNPSNPAHAPSPSYGNHHPRYTPYDNATNSQHAPMQHQTPRGPYQQQHSHSYASAPHHHHPNQMHGPPLSSSNQHLNYHHVQYPGQNPPLTSSNQATPLQGQQYPEHQRPSSQSPTPMQSSQRQYQKGYNRY